MSFGSDTPEYAASPPPLRTDTLVDSVLILLALTVVQRLVGFVRSVLFCRWLTPEQLGLWDMAFSFLLLAAPISVLAIPGAFGRYLEHYRQRGQLHVFLRRAVRVCGGLACVSITVIVLARRWLALLVFGDADQYPMVVLAAGCLTVVIIYNFIIESFIALRNIRLASIMQLINSVAFAALGVGLLLGWQYTAKSVLVFYGGSCLIAIVWAGYLLRRVCRNAPPDVAMGQHIKVWSKVVPFAAWVLLGSVLSNLFGVVDRYMILHFSNLTNIEALDAVGNYHASRVVPVLLVSIAMMLGSMITPHLSHDWEAGQHGQVVSRLRLFLKLFGFALFAAAVAVLVASPLLFNMVFRGKFPEGQHVLPWTLIYCTWFGLAMIVECYLLCAEKARLPSVALACGLALNVPLNLLLLPRFGLQGAVLATAAANAFSLGLICWFNRRLGFHFDAGTTLVLVLPIVLCLGPWVAVVTLPVVAAIAIWSDWLLSPEEKHQLAEGLAEYKKRIGLGR